MQAPSLEPPAAADSVFGSHASYSTRPQSRSEQAQPQPQVPQQQQQPQHCPPAAAAGTASGSVGGQPVTPAPQQGPVTLAQPWTDLVGKWWSSLGTGCVQLVWLLGRVVVPSACVVLAGSQPDVLHGVYLVMMLTYLLASSIGLQPSLPAVPLWWQQFACSSVASAGESNTGQADMSQDSASGHLQASTGRPGRRNKGQQQQEQQAPHALPAGYLPQHRLLRLYGSCHLLVVYLALVLQLPGLESELNEYILRLVGLWDPKILSDLLPVLLLLVAATIHVILGKWLMTRPPAGAAWPAAGSPVRASTTAPAAAAAGSTAPQSPASGADVSASVLEWLEAVYAKPVLRLVLATARLACSVGAAVLVLLVSRINILN